MRRHAFGICAILFLAGAAAGLWHFGVAEGQSSMLTGLCLRGGLVLGAIWLAYPQVEQLAERVPPWLLGCFALLAIILLVRPRAFPIVLPILAAIIVVQFVGWLFKPLPKSRAAPRRSRPRESNNNPAP
jgi:hypothetical protein